MKRDRSRTDDAEFLATLGAAVTAARKSRGWTQEEALSHLAVSLRTLQNIEAGRNDPRCSTLRQIALGLGVTLSDLVRGL